MNESIGSALLFNLVLVFVIVLSGLFIGSLAYTKAFKVKNKIIEEIEKNGEYSSNPEKAYDDAEGEIISWLNSKSDSGFGIGYRKNTNAGSRVSCPKYKDTTAINTISDYEYCIYMINTCVDSDNRNLKKDKCGLYYHVTTFMYVDFPIVDQFSIPVNGETMTFKIRTN